MPVESPSYFSTPNFKHYEAVIAPGAGGTREPNLVFTNTEVLVRASESNLPPTEPQTPQESPIELNPSLRFRGIPKWDMKGEMIRFLNDIEFGMQKGLSKEEAVAESAQIFEFHVRGYHSEITKTSPTLLHLNKFSEVEGKSRMVGVNGRPIVDSISSQERNGTVLDASVQIDNDLPLAPNNSFAVLMSPAGWHGFTDEFGQELSPHKNAQVLTFWKDNQGQLKGLTFHTDLNLDQAEEVMEELGASQRFNQGKTEAERIMEVVANPVCLKVPATYDNPFDYVLDKMLSIRGTDPFRLLQDDGSVEIRRIEDIRSSIQNYDQLLEGNLEEEALISSLTKFIGDNALMVEEGSVQQSIVDLAEKTILRLARGYLQELGKIPVDDPVKVKKWGIELKLGSKPEEDEFLREIAFLKTRAGCPPSVAQGLAGFSFGAASVSGPGEGGGSPFESDNYGSLVLYHDGCGAQPPRGRSLRSYGELLTHYQCCGEEIPRC